MPRVVLIFSKIDNYKHEEEITYCSENAIFYYQEMKLKILTIYSNRVW